MPPIQGVIGINEGIQILLSDSEIVEQSKAILPVNLKNAPPNIVEAFINSSLVITLAERFQAQIHVFSNPPLIINIICADIDAIVNPNWWAK